MNEIDRRKIIYNKGTRVQAVHFVETNSHINDNKTVPEGTFGTAESVDDRGTVFVNWDNGSSIGVLPEDSVKIVHNPDYAPLVDADDRPMKAGDWVSIYGSTEDVGRITYVSDPDGDADDEGRTIGINPKVYVKFPDGEDEFTTFWTAQWYTDADAPFKCEDLETCGDRDSNNDPGIEV